MTTEPYGNQLKGIAIKINHITSLLNKKPKTDGDSIISTFRKTAPLQLIRQQIENNKNTNIVIKVEDWTMECHLLVLQCYSEYFKRMNLDQGLTVELPVKRVSPKTFTDIYNWMLTEDPIVKREDIIEIFISACYLEVEPLVAQIWACFNDTEKMREAAAFFLYLEAALCRLDCVKELMLKRISKFFLIMVAFKEFLLMPFEDVCFILDSNNIGVNTEIEIFMAAIRWLHSDWTQRKKFLYKLMKVVRFNLIPPGFLIELDRNMIENDFIRNVMAEPKIRNLVADGLKFATTQLCYGNIVKQCLTEDKKFAKTKRRWLYDEKCEYHIKSNQLVEYKITYEKFVEYMNFLKETKSDHWEAFIDIKPEDYKTPNYVARKEFHICEVKQTRYACVVKDSTESEVSQQSLQTSLTNSSLKQKATRDRETEIVVKTKINSAVNRNHPQIQDLSEDLSENNCEISTQNILKRLKNKAENTLYKSFKGSIGSISRSYVAMKRGNPSEEYNLSAQQSKIAEKYTATEEIEQEEEEEDNEIALDQDLLNIDKNEEITERIGHPLKIPKTARIERQQREQQLLSTSRSCKVQKCHTARAVGKPKEFNSRSKHSHQSSKNFKCHKCKFEQQLESTSTDIRSSVENVDETTEIPSSTNDESKPATSTELQSFESANAFPQELSTNSKKAFHNFSCEFQALKSKPKIIPKKMFSSLHRSKSEETINSLKTEANTEIEPLHPKRILTDLSSEFQSIKFKKIVSDVGAELQKFKPKENHNETKQKSLVEVVTFNEIVARFQTLNLRNQVNEINSLTVTEEPQKEAPELESTHCPAIQVTETKAPLSEAQNSAAHLHKSIFKNKTLLVLGGTDPYNQHANYLDPKYGMNLVDKVLLYNDKLKQWSQLPHTAFGTRHHHATTVCNGLVYIIGGTKVIPGCKKAFFETSIWALNLKTKKWTFETNLPKNRRDFAVIPIEAKYGRSGFFIIGGETFDRAPLNSVWFYDVLKKSWERKAALQTGRYGFAAALVHNEIWIGGGIAYTGNSKSHETSGDISTRSYSEYITDTMERYNLEWAFKSGDKNSKRKSKEQWIQNKYHLRRPCLFGKFCLTKNNELYLIGGIGRNTENGLNLTSFNTIDRFDFKTEKWTQCGEMKFARHGHDVALIEDCIAIIGGVSSKEKCALKDIEFFSTKTFQTFRHIPSLPWPLSGLTAVVVRGEW